MNVEKEWELFKNNDFQKFRMDYLEKFKIDQSVHFKYDILPIDYDGCENDWIPIDQSFLELNFGWDMWLASRNREGYVLVPVEPTDKMTLKGYHSLDRFVSFTAINSIYKAMIGVVGDDLHK